MMQPAPVLSSRRGSTTTGRSPLFPEGGLLYSYMIRPALGGTMPEAFIVEAVRTPIGKRNGSLAEVHPVDLSAHVLRALVDRTGIDPSVVDDVVWGCVNQVGDQSSQV